MILIGHEYIKIVRSKCLISGMVLCSVDHTDSWIEIEYLKGRFYTILQLSLSRSLISLFIYHLTRHIIVSCEFRLEYLENNICAHENKDINKFSTISIKHKLPLVCTFTPYSTKFNYSVLFCFVQLHSLIFFITLTAMRIYKKISLRPRTPLYQAYV